MRELEQVSAPLESVSQGSPATVAVEVSRVLL